MKNIFWPILATVIFIVAIGFFTKGIQDETITLPNSEPTLIEISIGDNKLNVEIAKTESERRKGLSGGKSLLQNQGMLFDFTGENDTRPGFWMKDMQFPIDIIWISENKVIQIDKDVPPPEPNTPDTELVFYLPNQPIEYVLEVNAGYSEQNQLEIESPVDFSNL